MKKAFKYVYLLLFLAMLIVPLAMVNTQPDYKSETDNRTLAEFSDIERIGIAAGLRNYLQDRIGFRDEMLTGYQVLNAAVSGELLHPTYSYGKDGYVFFKMHTNVEYGDYHMSFVEAVIRMKEYCESRGVKFYFMFNPEKLSVYRQYLPAGVNYDDEWADILVADLEAQGVTVVDNRKLLSELSATEQVFNRRYDAGHWNDLGCYYGTNHLWETMHEDFPEVTAYTADEFEISTETGKYLANSRFPVNETVPDYKPKFTWSDQTSRYRGVRTHPSYTYFRYCVNKEENAGSLPRIMFFHGSYYNSRYEFLIGRCSEYIGIHDYQNVLDMDYYFNIFQPDAVVFEVAEYTFADNFFSSAEMNRINYNPGLKAAGQDQAEATAAALSWAEETDAADGAVLYAVPRDGYDNVYLDCGDLNANYVYLITADRMFDLETGESGLYRASVPHGAVADRCILYYEAESGDLYYREISAPCRKLAGSPETLFCTDGVSAEGDSGRYILETETENNQFNQINLQLLNGETGGFEELILNESKTGVYEGIYTHNRETGLYGIRLKANSNLQDERIDVQVRLEKGKKYFYLLNIKEFGSRKIVIGDYCFTGPEGQAE